MSSSGSSCTPTAGAVGTITGAAVGTGAAGSTAIDEPSIRGSGSCGVQATSAAASIPGASRDGSGRYTTVPSGRAA